MVPNVGFVLDKVALTRFFFVFFYLTIIIPPMLHIHLCGIWGWKVGLLEGPTPKNVVAFHPKIRKIKFQALEFMVQC